MHEETSIPIQISLKFVPKGPIDSKSALIPIMAWRRTATINWTNPDLVHAVLGADELRIQMELNVLHGT